MPAPHWRLILNGKSAGTDELRDAVGHWRGQGVQLDVRVTWEDGDAERYVAEAIDHGVDVIVADASDTLVDGGEGYDTVLVKLSDTIDSKVSQFKINVPEGSANDGKIELAWTLSDLLNNLETQI